jgi:hypothetical protein
VYNLNIEGFGSVPVGEEFLRLSPADQEAYVRRVVAERQGQQINVDQRGLGQNAGTLDRGVANIQQGVATTARRLGEAGVFPESMGAVAEAVAPDPSRLQGQANAGALSQDFLGNLDLIPGGVMEVLPSLGGVWASVKVGGAIGGPIGAFGGAAAYTLATALGPYAEEAARNNGRTTPNREDWTRGAAAAAAEGVFERIGVRGLGRGIVGGSVREGGTELAGSQAANAVTSVGTEAGYQVPTGSELATDFTLGAGAAGTVNTAAAAARVPGRVATAATQAIADVPRAREVAQYTDEQLGSDLRVVDAYNRRREAERGTARFGSTNSDPDPSVTFKGIKEDYTRALEGLVDAELAAGSITREQRNLIGREIRSARVHNQELADQAAALDYFESRRELIRGIGLNPDVERVVLDGLRDLNTATYNSMMKNKTGPFQRIGSRVAMSGVGALGIGAMTANPLAIVAGAGAAALGGVAGRGLDRAAGLSGPEVLARARVLSREAQKRNLQVDPLAPEIQDLTNSSRTAAQANATTQASQMAQYNAMANQMGLARGGGWAMSIAQQANGFAPGTVDIEDPVRAVEDLARAGVLDPQRAQTLINDRTARPTEPEMRLITDYVVSAASQTNREAWNARPGTQAPATSQVAPSGLPDPPVARVGNQGAYDAKMAQVNALNDAIRATATDPQARATAENVMGAKSKADKEAAFGQGTGDPAVDALLRATIAMTSARSRDPGTSVPGSTTGGVSGPPSGTRARSGGFQAVQDPTRRTTQRGGLQVDPFTGNQGRTETGRAAPGARNATAPGPRERGSGGLQYPTANKDTDGWYANSDYKARGGRMSTMSPDEFLGQVRPLPMDETARDNIDDLKRHIEAGRKLDPLVINKDGSEDGRHRAVAAKELGITSVPVIDYRDRGALSGASKHPFETKRLKAEERAKAAQQRAQELLDRADVTDAERRGVLLIDPLTVLEKNGGVMPGLKRQDAMAASKNLLEPTRQDAGIPVYDDISKPAAQKAVADLLYKESLFHLASSRNALDWYDGKVDTMFNMVERLYPELATDPNAKAMFSAILAITSNGQNVVKNFRDTFKHYGKHREALASGDYRIRTDLTGADKADKMNYAFGMWNSLLDQMGPGTLVEFLETKFRTGDLQKIMKDKYGIKWTGGEQADTEVYGASVFGPKIGGGFYVNLRKKFDAVTQDRWFVRTMSRVRGVLYKIPGVSESQAETLRQALNTADIAEFGLKPRNSWDGADVDTLVEAAMTIYRLDGKQGYPRTKNGKIPGTIDQDTKQFVMVPGADGRTYTGPVAPQSDATRKAAKRIVESFKGKMVDQPENKTQRTHYRAITDDVVKRLNDAGINISVADWQALVWFPEQRYWQRYLGSGSAKTDADYEDAVVMALLDEKREDIPREIYGLMGYSAAEIDGLIADRREKAKKLKGKPKPEDNQEDGDADEEDDD